MSANSTRPDTTTALLNDRQQGGAHALEVRPKTTTLALQTTSHVVGYMGDGINDALALPAADAGSAVDTAVDVAKKPFYARLEHAQRS